MHPLALLYKGGIIGGLYPNCPTWGFVVREWPKGKALNS